MFTQIALAALECEVGRLEIGVSESILASCSDACADRESNGALLSKSAAPCNPSPASCKWPATASATAWYRRVSPARSASAPANSCIFPNPPSPAPSAPSARSTSLFLPVGPTLLPSPETKSEGLRQPHTKFQNESSTTNTVFSAGAKGNSPINAKFFTHSAKDDCTVLISTAQNDPSFRRSGQGDFPDGFAVPSEPDRRSGENDRRKSPRTNHWLSRLAE